jgi:hypothetical protein
MSGLAHGTHLFGGFLLFNSDSYWISSCSSDRVWICCLHLKSEIKVELYLRPPYVFTAYYLISLRLAQEVAVNYSDIQFRYVSWCIVNSSEKISYLCGFEPMATCVQSYVAESTSVVWNICALLPYVSVMGFTESELVHSRYNTKEIVQWQQKWHL